ncbi:hypothetical protein GEV33_015327 [Tenebrio molitor]|uniref:Peptidase S1 domain-containing protein n=1 Tax=Tenebrio molitor TaxID=7067 RepID=A0A8J6H363_TENMO|nr:hypothetical protein GEV33_015327 [Tenebrio molitor]
MYNITKTKITGGRIIGGEEANAGQFPFAAAIYKSTADGRFFCGGAVAQPQWIITAGQCVDCALLFTIRLGSNNLNADDPNVLLLSTETYFLHPDYDPLTLSNDYGLIRLRMPITFTEYIWAASFLSANPLPAGAEVLTVGWGQISDETAGLVDDLRYVNLVTLSNEECRMVFGNQVNDNMVCVAGNNNEGTCRGDLGSPLIQYVGPMVFNVGVASFISSNGCESSDPSGFTRTYSYFDWIHNVTSNNT